MFESLLASFPTIGLMVVAILGGLWMFRQQLGEMQSKVIATYKEQNAQLEKELKACRREMKAMRLGFKQLGITIEIDDNEIILIDEGKKAERTRILTARINDDGTNKEEA